MSKQITYAEREGEDSFDWNEFLSRETYSVESLDEARDLANQWVTCACGNQCAAIPRFEDGLPKDLILRKLGFDFAGAIDTLHENYELNGLDHAVLKEVRGVLSEIEERSIELLSRL